MDQAGLKTFYSRLLEIEINAGVMYANFGDRRSRDRDLGSQKPSEKDDFWAKNLLTYI